MSSYPVCIPFTLNSLAAIREALPENMTAADRIEIYADFLSNEDRDILPASTLPQAIVTLRRPEFARQTLDSASRAALLESLSKTKMLVDLDIRREAEDIGHMRRIGECARLIASYHDYDRTPALDELLSIRDEMRAVSPGFVKFACFCRNDEDAVTLITLISLLQAEAGRFVVAGMGERGKVVRLTGALWGNAWTYVARSESGATAPGQFTHDEFSALMRLIGRS